MQIVSSTAELKEVCQRLAGADYITVDTEFLRDTTYWPKLCLIQVAGPNDEIIIDPLLDDLGLESFFELMTNHNVLKVFHAARQDLEIFYYLSRTIPEPMFDTQIAAMVCGFGDSVGYETLVAKLAKGTLDKTSRFTDWSHRPLSDRQLEYAIGDVTYLRTVYEKLSAKLDQNGRTEWLDEEMANLMNPKIYQMLPEDGWKRVKTKSTNRRFLGILVEIAAWREREAQGRDVPRRRILKDESLAEIAAHPPQSSKDLDRMRGIPRGFGNSKMAQDLLKAVADGVAMPDSALPMVNKPKNVPRGIGPVVDLLKVLLKMKCEEEHVAQKLVYNNSDLESLAADDNADIPLLNGWRRDLFGKDALALKHGKLALAIEGHKLRFVTVEAADLAASNDGD
ncbi:MAG: ribonuclease D [Rhodospirillales bacterium]|nr:ribonuclease D [Rhodospirillales bacterium]